MRFFRRRAADTTQAAGLWAPGERADIRGRLERILQENIVPFWARVADYEHGGYRHNHDGAGNDLGPAPKRAIAGARTAWFFAAMERSPYGEAEHERLAAHGLASLREQLWDPLNGGVFWEVDATGRKATRAEKHPVAQAFALYAAAELALSGHDGAAELADSLFDLLESRAHDPQNGGYFESFGADWRPLGSGRNLLGHPPGVKTVDTHLHLLEALTPYAKLGHRQIARDRLYELVLILMRTVVRRDHPSARAGSSDAWQALGGRPDKQAAHGHDIEMVWLVADAMDALGQSQTPLRDTYQAIADHVIACAFDQERGGFYERGKRGAACARPPQGVVGAGRGAGRDALARAPHRRAALSQRLRSDPDLDRAVTGGLGAW